MQIIAYKKYSDSLISRTLQLAQDKNGQPIGTELATLADGLTYVAMSAAAKLPVQPKEIAKTVKTVVLTVAQIAEIKAVSPHVRLINQRVQQRIADKYSMGEEIKMLRLAPSPATSAYNTYVEDCRAWGRAEKANIGL